MHRAAAPSLPPNLGETLRVAAARERLGLLEYAVYGQLGHAVLEAGVYSAAMAELAGFCPSPPPDPGEVFERGLEEMGLALPTEAEAHLELVNHYMREIGRELRSPYEVMDELRHEMFELFYDGREFAPPGARRELDRLIRAYWEADTHRCCGFESAAAYVEDQMLVMALAWLWKYGAP